MTSDNLREPEKIEESTGPRKPTSSKQLLCLMIFLMPVLCAYGKAVDEAMRVGGIEELKILFCVLIPGVLGSGFLIAKMFKAKKNRKDLLDGRTALEALFIFILLFLVMYALKDFVPDEMLKSYDSTARNELKLVKNREPANLSETQATLLQRISITPARMGHDSVKPETVEAAKQAVNSLPEIVRNKLDRYGAAISISPNLIDKWPESIKDLPENIKDKNLAELPGRIYGKEMNIYERPKIRKSTKLGEARSFNEIKHTTLNQCIQVYDDATGFTRDPGLRKVYELDKQGIKGDDRIKLQTFLKENDWGPRETCAETAAAMLGGGDEYTKDLFRCFPKTRQWLKENLQIKEG